MADLSDRQVDIIEAELDKTLALINTNILRLIGKLDTGQGGRLDKLELTRLRATRRAIAKQFDLFIDTASDVTKFGMVKKAIKARLEGVSPSFTQSDNALLKIMSDSAFREMSGLADQYVEKVNGAIFRGTTAGTPINIIEQEVKQLLVGGTDAAGRPMSSHAKTITSTRYMEADATMTIQAADNIGADKFRYSGSLIKDSRQWCKDHAGKIYTREEIEEWNDSTWGGKKEGDPFITRGGWNCRHVFIPVIEDNE